MAEADVLHSNKHSSFSTSFPIYLFTQLELEVPEEEPEASSEETSPNMDTKEIADDDEDDDVVVIEDVPEIEKEENKEVKMKKVMVDEWMHLNPLPPIWMRDPKNVSDEDYSLFYQATFRDFTPPLAWHHFSGDSGSGVSFKAILFVPSHL